MNQELIVPETLMPTVMEFEPPMLMPYEVVRAEAIEIAKTGLLALKAISDCKEITNAEQFKDILDASKTCRGTDKRLDDHRKSFTDPAESYKKGMIASYKPAQDIFQQGFTQGEKLASDWSRKENERIAAEKARLLREQQERERLAEAERQKKIAEEQAKQAEEDEKLEQAMREADAKAEAEGAGTAEHMKADAELKAQQAEIERQRAEREEQQRKADADAKAENEKKQRELYAQTSTLNHTAPKGVKEPWAYDIIDPDKVVRSMCSPDKVKLNAACKAGLLVGELAAGLDVYRKAKLTGRGGGAR